jgi:hypothetical protein
MVDNIKEMYYNFITNLINYFEIRDIDEFRDIIAAHINNPPNIKDESDIKSWYVYLSKIILSFTTLDDEELKRRYVKEFKEVLSLSKETLNA